MAERLQTDDGIEILDEWKSSFPFFPKLQQRNNSIQKIEKQYLQEGQLNILPSTFMPINDIVENVKTCLRKTFKEGLVLVSGSLITLMDIEAPTVRPPEEIQCEVLIVVPDEPAMVLCVLEQPCSDLNLVQKHLKHLAQHIMYSVRMFSDEHFIVLHGHVANAAFSSTETLRKTLRAIIEKRSRFCHPEALSMGKRKYRNIGLAVLASIAVTDIPWHLSTDDASNRRASDEKELWFLTKEQFNVLSETVDITGQWNSLSLDLNETGGEVEVNMDGTSFMVLELAKRWNKLKPTLACTKVLQHFPKRISKRSALPEITNTAELRAGQASVDDICYVVAEDISEEHVKKLLAGQNHIDRCIVFKSNESNSPISATEDIRNWKAQGDLGRITFLEGSDAEINQDADIFVETSLFKKALNLILDKKCIVITGASGDGKTSIARALCRHFRDSRSKRYTPMFIRHIDDFSTFADAKENQIFVLEDMFGVINFSVEKLLEWEKMLPKLEYVIKRSDSMLVVTCKSGFEEKALPVISRLPSFNRECIFDISNSLTFEDKMELVNTYGQSVDIADALWETLDLKDDIGFPLSCKCILNQREDIETIVRGFRRPIEYLRRDLHKLISEDTLHHAFLVMLVSCDGTVDSSSETHIIKWNLILQHFAYDIDLAQVKNFKDVRKKMPKCYIQSHPLKPNITSFTHQAVFFAGLQCIAMENIALLIEFADPTVVSQYMVLDTLNANVCEKTIRIPQIIEKKLLEKFVNIFENEQNGSMFLNTSFKDVSFAQKYITVLKQKRLIGCVLGTMEANETTPLKLIIFSKNINLFTQVMNTKIGDKLSGNAYSDLLVTCCKSGNVSALNLLLQTCHNVSLQNLLLCLEGAVVWFHQDMVSHLLRHRTSRFKTTEAEVIQNLLKEYKFDIVSSVLQAVDKVTLNTLSEKQFWCVHHNVECTLVTCLTERQDMARLRQFCNIGANMNACNGKRETPLHIACRNKDENLVEFLITHGVNLKARTNDGKTPVDYACQYKSNEILRTLLLSLSQGLNTTIHPQEASFSDHKIEIGNLAQTTSLNLSCILGQENAFQFLISIGEDINSKDKFGKSPLHLAIEHGHSNIVDHLLHRQVNVFSPDMNGRTPLFVACSLQDISTAKKLIDYGCDVNKGDNSGYAPLHVAADLEQDNLVELLLQNDADVDKKTTEGMTPLHLACKKTNYQTVKLLTDKGASVRIKDRNGQTPLDLAKNVGEKSILNTILRRHEMTAARDKNKSPKSWRKASSD